MPDLAVGRAALSGWARPAIQPGAHTLKPASMPRLRFESFRPAPANPLRADIALFVGFAAWRNAAVGPRGAAPDAPVAIESWDEFDDRFAWERRPVGDGRGNVVETYLGAAVRTFFRQGGRRCWVVSVGEPWAVNGVRDRGLAHRILPAERFHSPVDPSTWRGVLHLLGLPEVSFLCAPDLPDLFASEVGAVAPSEPAPRTPERFIEGAEFPVPERHQRLRWLGGPRCDAAGFEAWASLVGRIGGLVSRHAREVQFIAALPRAVAAPAARRAQWTTLLDRSRDGEAGVGSAFVQLAYPWLRWDADGRLPEDLEPPDGALAGILAQTALARGAYSSAAGTAVPMLTGVEPELGPDELERVIPPGTGSRPGFDSTVLGRVSIFGPTSSGPALLSDVTTDLDERWRPAQVNRLMGAVVRSARLAGELGMFENNGEALWAQLRESVSAFMTDLWRDGALEGTVPEEAFEVRCDRTTITPADLDAGRAMVTVRFTAAGSIDAIVVVLRVDESGAVTLHGVRSAERREAA